MIRSRHSQRLRITIRFNVRFYHVRSRSTKEIRRRTIIIDLTQFIKVDKYIVKKILLLSKVTQDDGSNWLH